MILHKGDMFDVWGKTDLFMFTSNPIVNKQGLAVMGRGIAKQLADRIPTIRKDFADKILSDPWHMPSGWFATYDEQPVGYFMVKSHWAEPAKLEIIKRSLGSLVDYITEEVAIWENKDLRIDLNFPGIGNGKLKREDVLPIIQYLPDNVHIWEYGE